MRKLEALLRAIDAISENTGKFCSWFMVIAALLVLYEVIAHKVFGAPTRWVFETSLMLWGAYFVMVIAWTQRVGGHVSVDVIYNRFPTRVRVALDLLFCLVLCFVWIGAVIVGGMEVAIRSWELGERTLTPWAPPIYPLKTVLPIAFALLGLQCLAKFIRDLITLITGKV